MQRSEASLEDDLGDVAPAIDATSRAPSLLTERARLAGITARHGRESERARNARRDYHAIALAEHIRRVVDAAPPLTADQRSKLAVLLQPSTPARPAEVA